MKYDIQFSVIIFQGKYFISHLAAVAIGKDFTNTTILNFNNKYQLVEVKNNEKELIKNYPTYNLDAMLNSFVEPAKDADVYYGDKKDSFVFQGETYYPLSKLAYKNKYQLKYILPCVKIFGTYYVVCNKQKDVNTKYVLKVK
ncbi:MAG: hypothetical protein KBG30_04915 [Bacteroidales bacterium]|nr:hypothetical protein [Bacteroidales bacterium]